MTKREIKKAAYESIVKNRKSHQETFDSLRLDKTSDLDELAEIISKIPSENKNNKYQNLRYIFIGTLILVLLIRSLSVVLYMLSEQADRTVMLIGLVVILIAPAVGIYAALSSKIDNYHSSAILLILVIVRSFRENIEPDIWTMLSIAPFLVAIALAFYIPTKLKTNYTKSTINEEKDGIIHKKLVYTFENSEELKNSELLDSF